MNLEIRETGDWTTVPLLFLALYVAAVVIPYGMRQYRLTGGLGRGWFFIVAIPLLLFGPTLINYAVFRYVCATEAGFHIASSGSDVNGFLTLREPDLQPGYCGSTCEHVLSLGYNFAEVPLVWSYGFPPTVEDADIELPPEVALAGYRYTAIRNNRFHRCPGVPHMKREVGCRKGIDAGCVPSEDRIKLCIYREVTSRFRASHIIQSRRKLFVGLVPVTEYTLWERETGMLSGSDVRASFSIGTAHSYFEHVAHLFVGSPPRHRATCAGANASYEKLITSVGRS